MATCETWEPPYDLDGVTGATELAVCNKYAETNYEYVMDVRVQYGYCAILDLDGNEVYIQTISQVCEPRSATGNQNSINCEGSCTVGIELKPAAPDIENIADMSLVFGLFFVAIITVFCLRSLLKIFESSPHGDN